MSRLHVEAEGKQDLRLDSGHAIPPSIIILPDVIHQPWRDCNVGCSPQRLVQPMINVDDIAHPSTTFFDLAGNQGAGHGYLLNDEQVRSIEEGSLLTSSAKLLTER